MRYTDIWIVESLIEAKNNAKSIEDNLDDISTIVHNNPEIENDILVSMKELLLQQQETLEQLEAKIKEIFEPKIGHEPTDESITEVSQEDVEYEFDHLAGNLENRAYEIDQFIQTCSKPEHANNADMQNLCRAAAGNLENVDTELEELRTQALAYAKQQHSSGKEEGRSEIKAEVAKLSTLVGTLARKAQNHTLLSSSDFESLKAKDKKQYINAGLFTQEMEDFLQGFFSNFIFGENPVLELGEVREFIEAAVQGHVLNVEDMVKDSSGFMNMHVNGTYKKVWDVIIPAIIKYKGPAKTAGNVGPAEMAIAMLGGPEAASVRKAEVGDIEISGVMYEIKAGDKSGGRMGSKSLLSGSAGWTEWNAGIDAIMNQYEEGDQKGYYGKSPISINDYNQPMGRQDNQGHGTQLSKTDPNYPGGTVQGGGSTYINISKDKKHIRAKEASKYNFTPEGLIRLNKEILGPYSTYKLTYRLLLSAFNGLMPEGAGALRNIPGYKNIIHDMIVRSDTNKFKNGMLKFEDDAIFKNYARLTYESYRLADGQEGILNMLFISTNVATDIAYSIIRSGNDLIGGWNKPGGIMKKSGFNWNDDQQKASPQYLVFQ